MEISFPAYFIGSLYFFISSLEKPYKDSKCLYDLWQQIVESKKLFSLMINLVGTIFFAILRYFQDFIVGKINSSIYAEVKNDMNNTVIDLFIFFILLPHKITANVFVFLLHVGLRVFGAILLGRVNSIYHLPHRPKLKVHVILLVAEFFCFFCDLSIELKYFVASLQKEEILSCPSFFALLYLIILIDITGSLFNHFLYLSDHEQLGNSKQCVTIKTNVEAFIDILKSLLMFLYLIIGPDRPVEYTFYLLYHLGITIFSLTLRVRSTLHLRHLLDVLSNVLSDASESDLALDNNCLICRDAMVLGHSKKLPCGHCYHIECLDKWISQASRCPICHYDLSNFLEGQPEEETPQQRAAKIMVHVRQMVVHEQKKVELPTEKDELDYFHQLQYEHDLQTGKIIPEEEEEEQDYDSVKEEIEYNESQS